MIFSGVVEFLSKGAISREHPDLKEFRQDPCVTRFSASDDPTVYTHGLRLDCSVDPNSMSFTNYTLVLNLKTCIKDLILSVSDSDSFDLIHLRFICLFDSRTKLMFVIF